MRPRILLLLLLLTALLPAPRACAQDVRAKAREMAREARRPVRGTPMYFELDEQGDTVFMETLDPVWIFPKGRRMRDGDWRRYYKLVYTVRAKATSTYQASNAKKVTLYIRVR